MASTETTGTGSVSTVTRDYAPLVTAARALPVGATVEERMRCVVDLIWNAFHAKGVSWVGFYFDRPREPDDRRLVLAPCRDKPACSPLGLHGACGQAVVSRRTLLVRDVRELGANYIACDPRDKSEIVIPLLRQSGEAWGVLDIDSREYGTFDERDERGLRDLLDAAGLLCMHQP